GGGGGEPAKPGGDRSRDLAGDNDAHLRSGLGGSHRGNPGANVGGNAADARFGSDPRGSFRSDFGAGFGHDPRAFRSDFGADFGHDPHAGFRSDFSAAFGHDPRAN